MSAPSDTAEAVEPRYSAKQLGRRTEAEVDEIAARVAHYARPWWQRWRTQQRQE